MNAATLPPWLTPWSQGLVFGQNNFKTSAGERYRPVDRSRHRSRLTIFTYGHDNAPILSWAESGSGGGDGGAGAGRFEVVGASPKPPPGPGLRWERVPIDRAPWLVDVPMPDETHQYTRPGRYNLLDHGSDSLEYETAMRTPVRSARDAAEAWGGALRGWAAGATLLALLVVIARSAERCLDWRFMRRRRRLHQEWQRANVQAICRDDDGPLPADLSNIADLPPPYSACSNVGVAAVAVPKPPTEEPPPPYTESCVQFVNKNGVPVLVYSRNRLSQNGNRDEVCVEIPQGEGDEQDVGRILEACGIHVNRTAVTATDEANTINESAELTNEETVLIHDDTSVLPMPLPPPPAGFTDSADNSTDASPVHIATIDNASDQPADDVAFEVVGAKTDIRNDTNDNPKDGSVEV